MPALYLVGLLFRVLFYVVTAIVGIPLTVFKLDKGKGPDDVLGGYMSILSIGGTFGAAFVMQVASATGVPSLVRAMVISMFSGMILSVLTPACKRLYERDWLFVAPGILLALEVGQVALFLQMRLNDPQLYMTVFFQISYRRVTR